MTVLVEGSNSFFLGTQAILVDDERDVASSWANQHIVPNKAIKWVIGKYVEADNANYNGQYWSLADLQMKKPTILHSPMNINHQPKKIVGAFVAAEMMYPRGADPDQAQEDDDNQQDFHPYIETLGAFWRYYFPEEMAVVEKAFDSGECFLSMECISSTVTCVGPNGCGEVFQYDGPRSATYCAHLLGDSGVKQLNDPHFLAGALIIPPAQPGWGGASVKELSKLIQDNASTAERIYDEVSSEMPHLDSSKWEQLMGQLMLKAESQSEKVPADILGRRIARNSITSR
jgi:hypothetical protein